MFYKKSKHRKRQRRNKPRKKKRTVSSNKRFLATIRNNSNKQSNNSSRKVKTPKQSESRFDKLYESLVNLIHNQQTEVYNHIKHFLNLSDQEKTPDENDDPNSLWILDTRKAQTHTFKSFVERITDESLDYYSNSFNCIKFNNNNNFNGIDKINNINDINPIYLSKHFNSNHTSFIDKIYNDKTIPHTDKIYQINNYISDCIKNKSYYNNNNNHSTHSHYCSTCSNCKFYDFDNVQSNFDKLQSISQCNDKFCNCIHHINTINKSEYVYASYRGKQWPEQTTNTSHFDHTWSIRVWTEDKKELFLFADTGASINACNEHYARKHFSDKIKKRKSSLQVRVANGTIVNLQEFVLLPIYDESGNKRLEVEFYLLPGLKHHMLASFYLLQKLQLQFPRDAPLLTKNIKLNKTQHHHPEEDDETFGDCNNWDNKSITTRLQQTDYSKDPNFKPYSHNYNIDPYKYEYERLHSIYNFDFQRFTPQSIVTDPYHNKTKIYNINNYSTFTNTDINTLHSITINSQKHIQRYTSIKQVLTIQGWSREATPNATISVNKHNLCHISNYKASAEELKRANELVDARPFDHVKLDHLKKIDYQLYQKSTKLLYSTISDLFAKDQYSTRIIPNYEFKIDLTADAPSRIFIKQYPLSPEKRLVIIKTAIQNQKSGIFVIDNQSPHNVPIIIIQKKGKTKRLRPAYALQHLNKYTITEQAHIPSYAYIFENMRGQGYFTTTDAKNYFECLLLRAKDRPLCHVTTPIGEFNLTRGTYGFKNIMALAQDITNYLVRPFTKAVGFVDDIIKKHAPNATPEELYQDVYELFTRAYEIGLLFHPEKTYLFAEEVEYLGYIFNQHGVIPRPEYIQKVLQFLPPRTKKEIQQYIAILNYIAKFLPNLAKYTQSINKLTLKNAQFIWTKEQQHAFDKIQELLKRTPLLAHPTDEGEYLVQTDASKHAMAAVLYQRQLNQHTNKHEWKIIEFYSKQFPSHLENHPIMIKECLAITYALNHWQHFLLRKKFFVDTDHRNLISLYDSDEMKAAHMKKKQMFVTMRNAIAQFNFQIAHLKGTQIPLPDYLTRDGSTAYRTAPVRLHKAKLIKQEFMDKNDKDKWKAVINYMQHIRLNLIDYPPNLKSFEKSKNGSFDRLCMINEIHLIDKRNWIEKTLIKDRLQYIAHEPPLSKNPLNRWKRYINDKHNQQPKFHFNQINSIHSPNPRYAIPGEIQIVNTIEEVNTLHLYKVQSKQHLQASPAKPEKEKEKKPKPKKRVTFNLTPIMTKERTTVAQKPILKNPPKIDYNGPEADRRLKSKMYMYDVNKRAFDHYLYDTLDRAFINRFTNQYSNEEPNHITSDTIADMNCLLLDNLHHNTHINSIYFIPEPVKKEPPKTQEKPKSKSTTNYHTDKHGNRRSQRKRKPRKTFYGAYPSEQQQIKRAQQYPGVSRDEEEEISPEQSDAEYESLSSSQKKRRAKEKKYKMTPKRTHDLFKSLYHDVYRADEIDSLLSNKKLQINQQNDPICQILIDYIQDKITTKCDKMKQLQKHYYRLYKLLTADRFYINENNLVCLAADPSDTNDLAATDRLYIPTNLIRVALKYTHSTNNFSHPGITQMKQLVKNKFYWHKWQSDCQRYVKQCPQCQKAKGHKFHKRGKLAPIITHQFNDVVHLDFFGPIHKDLNVLIITDNLTGWTMLVPIFGQTAQDVIMAIWNHWRPINGLPRKCITDRGKGFISELNQRFYDTFHIKGLFTSGYHPQTNAKAERRVQEAKKAIRMLNTTLHGELTDKKNQKNAIKSIQLLLPSIQFSLNQKPYAFCGISPNMLTRGTNLNEPIDIPASLKKIAKTAKMKKYKTSQQLFTTLKNSLTHVRQLFNNHRWYYISNMLKQFNKGKSDDKLQQGDKVMYYVGDRSYPMKKIRPRFTGPFLITKRINHNTVEIFNDDTNETLTCHTQKLKKFYPNTFTEESDFIRQLKQLQRLNKQYRRKHGNKIKTLKS